jgi:hypothetical protein
MMCYNKEILDDELSRLAELKAKLARIRERKVTDIKSWMK